jgi:hypothetical protein
MGYGKVLEENIGRNIEHFKQREREVGGESDTSSGKRRGMESFAENGIKFGVTLPTVRPRPRAREVSGGKAMEVRDRDKISIIAQSYVRNQLLQHCLNLPSGSRYHVQSHRDRRRE